MKIYNYTVQFKQSSTCSGFQRCGVAQYERNLKPRLLRAPTLLPDKQDNQI